VNSSKRSSKILTDGVVSLGAISSRSIPLGGAVYRLRVLRLSALCFAAAPLFSGCAVSVNSGSELARSVLIEEENRSDQDDIIVPKSAEARYAYLRGEIALNNEQFDDALDFFEQAMKKEPHPTPALYRRLAQVYVRQGELDKALGLVEQAIKKSPDDTELLQFKAGILATLRRPDDAIPIYREVLARSPQPPEELYVLLASLYAQEDRFDEAQDILLKLIASNSQSFLGHYYMARTLEAHGKLPQAEVYYLKAIALQPEQEQVKLDYARVLAAQKKVEPAREVLQGMIDINPRNVAAKSMLAQLLVADNKLDQALEQFEQVREMESDPTDTRFKIALIKLQRGDMVGAESELSLILAQHPENDTARYYLATTYVGQKRMGDAAAELKKIDATSDLFVESRTLGAYLFKQQKQYDQAIEMISDALKSKPDDLKLLNFLASLHNDAEHFDKAIEVGKKLTELDPKNDKYHFQLGVYLDQAKRHEESEVSIRKAIEINPKNAEALNFLGYTYAEQNRKLEEAEALVRRALAEDKDNGYFLDSLGWIYFKRGQFSEALTEITKAVEVTKTDAVILEHLALVQHKLAQNAKALETARRALQYAPQSDDPQVAERLNQLITEIESLTRK
jgi:tetratricopeptide (TPR) repeat protein